MKRLLMLVSISIILLFGAAHSISAQDSSMISSEPKNLNELNSIITKLLKEKRFEESLFYLDKILEIDPNHTSALLNKGSVLISLDRPNESIVYFDRLLTIEPNNIKALTGKAAVFSNMGEYVKALELYNKALSIDKYNAEIGNEIVNLLSKTPIIPVSGSYDKNNDESIIDVQIRATVRNASGELVAVIEDSHGRYLPVSFFTDQVFDEYFEKEIVEINDQKFEVLTYETMQNITEKNYTITGGFTFSPIKSGSHEVVVFHIYTANIETEMDDEIFIEWTIVRKST